MRSIVIWIMLLFSLEGISQVELENREKYWAYRSRLITNFLKVGKLSGESIPMTARGIGFAYNGAPVNSEGLKPSRIWYGDATIYLGHYLAFLAI